ncbi:MAG: hypothetical protein ABF780_03745 [Bifidobacterium aquikefiri]|uniref:Uncharacterized protein n=1 Tax=Bifidobacterium aquikefiri TaxID=1653207 RepID=A0A261G0W3_9BIFI|nr:hypothetical protein [Bifidobacterium aquikefiri]OZG65084.1 hypothetical protein BAQU_1824 [Bifidobacterium aquikefiri]
MNGRIEHTEHVSLTRDSDGRLVRTSIEVTKVSTSSQCFDPSTCCDAHERAVIETLRDYLRPQVAPQCLLRRLHQFMDETTSDLKHDDTSRQ